MARDGENSRESMRGGVWGICSPTGHRVISREAIMASLHQNRKHYEIGLFTPTRARLTAGSTLAPFSHPHILLTRALSAARRLCPHRRCHKTPSMPPAHSTPHNPSLFDLKEDTVNLLIVLCDYSSGLLLWVTGHMSHGMPKNLKNKKQSNFRGTNRSTV